MICDDCRTLLPGAELGQARPVYVNVGGEIVGEVCEGCAAALVKERTAKRHATREVLKATLEQLRKALSK